MRSPPTLRWWSHYRTSHSLQFILIMLQLHRPLRFNWQKTLVQPQPTTDPNTCHSGCDNNDIAWPPRRLKNPCQLTVTTEESFRGRRRRYSMFNFFRSRLFYYCLSQTNPPAPRAPVDCRFMVITVESSSNAISILPFIHSTNSIAVFGAMIENR